MRWDLVNPWARLYELSSTHPLTALRVRALNEDAAALNQTPAYSFSTDTGVEWGRFPLEVLLWAVPVITGWVLFVDMTIERWSIHGFGLTARSAAGLLIATGALWILRTLYRYNGEFSRRAWHARSRMSRFRRCARARVKVEDEIAGLGVPGAFSGCPDLVLRDATGMLFVLYRQSIPFARLLFALMSSDQLIGKRVTIEGWFRRGLRPYIEMSSLHDRGRHDETGLVALDSIRAGNRSCYRGLALAFRREIEPRRLCAGHLLRWKM